MKGKIEQLLATLLFCVLLTTLFQTSPVQAQTQKGPRSPGLDIYSYTCPELCYVALKLGSIDIMAWPLSTSMYKEISGNPGLNLLLAPYTNSYEMLGYSFNTNQTINTYGHTVNSLLNNETFRKALAFLVNKNYIIDHIFECFAERIDVPFPKAQEDWWNTSVSYPNYPYEYNPSQAQAILDGAGFQDIDHDGTRNYPAGWGGRPGRPNLDRIVFYVENNDQSKTAMGNLLRDEMISIGIPVDYRERSSSVIYSEVTVGRDYHIYVGSQVAYAVPIWFAFLGTLVFSASFLGQQYRYAELWEYMNYINWNLYSVGLAPLLKKVMRASSWEEQIQNAKDAQGVYVQHAFEIPVCSLKSYFAYSKKLAGMVDEKGFGTDNPYTYLNAYRTDNPSQPIRIGLVSDPMQMNILYSSRQPDYQVLDKIYTGLIYHDPYDPSIDQPWIAQDWTSGSWVDPNDGQEKTYVDYYFRKDAYWVKPVTGETDGLFDAKDYEFTCHYIYAQYPYVEGIQFGCPHYDRFKHIDHVEILNDFEAKVYMDDLYGVAAYQWPTYPLLPKHKWLREPLAHNRSIYLGDYNWIELPGPLPLNEYVVSGLIDTKVKVLLANGQQSWLNYGADFMWKKGELYVNVNSVNGVGISKILWAYYWANGDPLGYFPGGIDWTDILEGCGTHYAVNICGYPPTAFLLSSNRHFFMETPILGEIDWRWNTVGTTHPLRGNYKIDILDVAKVTGAYCTRGDGIPNPSWNPGADIDSADVGHVGILDLIQVTNNYAKTFGEPPP